MCDVQLLCYATDAVCLPEPDPLSELTSVSNTSRLHALYSAAVSRSPVLQVCLGTSQFNPDVLPVPVSELRDWLRLVELIDTASPALRKLSLSRLLHGAQVWFHAGA